jgi:hypothetical protein
MEEQALQVRVRAVRSVSLRDRIEHAAEHGEGANLSQARHELALGNLNREESRADSTSNCVGFKSPVFRARATVNAA